MLLESDRDRISLFLRGIQKKDQDPHWFLVQTYRNGMTQIVQSAWRVFPSDVDLTNANRPVEMLKAFAETFGVPITVGRTRSKFVASEFVLTGGAMGQDLEFEIKVEDVPGDFFMSVSHVKNSSRTLANVGVAYCIDMNKYKLALRAHGFSV